MNVDDLAIKDLKIENYTVHHVHGERWKIMAQGTDGRLRTAEGDSPKDLLRALWVRALLDGSPLPSIDNEDYVYVLSTIESKNDGKTNFVRHEQFTERQEMMKKATSLNGAKVSLSIKYEDHTVMSIPISDLPTRVLA